MLNRIKTMINTLGISQNKFAQQIGTDGSILSAILNGKRKLNDATIARIVARSGVSEKWLLTGVGEMFVVDEKQTPREYAKSAGCSDLFADVFANFCALDADGKKRFNEALDVVLALAAKDSPPPPLDTVQPTDGSPIVATINADRAGTVNQIINGK